VCYLSTFGIIPKYGPFFKQKKAFFDCAGLPEAAMRNVQ